MMIFGAILCFIVFGINNDDV